ncbi:MAG TPA: class I SAM-dependent methyltransferase [Candidatus Dojkabacteria bacterium]|nr:class I SAM-dependent methyltransferase [Candidatus Dojkabacteria bacterium]
MDIPDLLNGVNGAELLEPNEKDREYIRKYKEIQLGIDPDEPAFVITPRMLSVIEKMLPEFADKVAKALKLNGKDDGKWEVGSMIAILAKSLTVESNRFETWVAKRIVQEARGKESMLMCDLCSGTGATSSMLYFESKKAGIKNVQIDAVDKSVESLSMAYLVFRTQGIPCILLDDNKKIREIPYNFDGIVLIFSDAQKYMDCIDEEIKYDNVVSSNGISYFPREAHDKVLIDTKKHLKGDSGVYIVSPHRHLPVEVDKLFLMKQILKSKGNTGEEYLKRIRDGEPEYKISIDKNKNPKVTKLMSVEAGRSIDFINYLLKNNFPAFLGYIRGVMKSMDVVKGVIKELHSPVEEIKDSVYQIFGNNIKTQLYPQVIGSSCDVIEIRM